MGPLMFNIFTNSISKVPLSHNCHLILYTDDSFLLKLIDSSSVSDDTNVFQQDLNRIAKWTHQLGIELNHKKTLNLDPHHHIQKSTTDMPLHPPPPRQIPRSIYHPESLLVKAHREHRQALQTAARSNAQNLHDDPNHLKQKIYQTIVLPELEYCCAVWDPHHSTLKKQLEKGSEMCWQSHHWSLSYQPLCSALKPPDSGYQETTHRNCYNILTGHLCVALLLDTTPLPSSRSVHPFKLYIPIIMCLQLPTSSLFCQHCPLLELPSRGHCLSPNFQN